MGRPSEEQLAATVQITAEAPERVHLQTRIYIACSLEEKIASECFWWTTVLMDYRLCQPATPFLSTYVCFATLHTSHIPKSSSSVKPLRVSQSIDEPNQTNQAWTLLLFISVVDHRLVWSFLPLLVDLFLFFFVLLSKRQHPKTQSNDLEEEHAKQELWKRHRVQHVS